MRVSTPLTRPGPGAHLAETTRLSYRQAWGRFLSFLVASGEMVASESPAERLTPARVIAFYLHLREEVRPSTMQSIAVRLSYMADLLAPGGDWKWIRRQLALPTAAEVRASQKPIDPPDPVMLLGLALEHAASAADIQDPGRAAIVCRDGALLALDIMTGLRRKNLAELQLGIHLIVDGDRMRLAIHHSMKNHTVLDVPIPGLLLPCLRSWLLHHRPYLLRNRPASDMVWIAADGRPVTYEALREIFMRLGHKLIGRPLTLHHLRHAMATAIMEDNPRNFAIASSALAHKGTSTVNRTYDRSGDQAANTILRDAIRERLREARENMQSDCRDE